MKNLIFISLFLKISIFVESEKSHLMLVLIDYLICELVPCLSGIKYLFANCPECLKINIYLLIVPSV